MLRKTVVLTFVFALVLMCGLSEAAQDKDKKKRTGTITGELQSRKDTPNGKNVIMEILASGEEKARPYRVHYDPKAKGPIAEVLKAAKEAAIGDRVRCDWIDTGEGLAVTSIQVLKAVAKTNDKVKTNDKDKDFDANGLVLLNSTLKATRDKVGGEITGIVENRRKVNLAYAEITFNLYDQSGAQVGTAVANIKNLEAGARWNFRAVTANDRWEKYKCTGLTGR